MGARGYVEGLEDVLVAVAARYGVAAAGRQPGAPGVWVARARKLLELGDGDALRWACEPKFDGVSANLLYENGRFVRGLSRGNGESGEDISNNLRTVRNLPLQLLGDGPFPARIEVRGEVIMSRSDFATLRDSEETSTEGTFRNARNTVAGTLKLMDPRTVKSRPLTLFAFAIGHVEGFEFGTHTQLREQLAAWGFQVAEPYAVADDMAAVHAFHDDLERRRDDLPFEMDGIVAKVDRLDSQQKLGRTSRTPRWALAYKFAPRIGTTKLIGIGVFKFWRICWTAPGMARAYLMKAFIRVSASA